MSTQRPNDALQRPAIALLLQSWRPVGRVAELGSLDDYARWINPAWRAGPDRE